MTHTDHPQPSRPTLGTRLFLILATCLPAFAWSATCYDPAPAHQCLQSQNPVRACEDFLRSDPYDLQVRFSLCAAQIKQNAPVKALITLDQGLKLCGQDRNSCARIEAAVASLEQESKQAPGSAEFRSAQENNRRECTNRKAKSLHQSMLACEEALLAFPNDADLHGAFGEKLLKNGQPAQAVLSFRRALVLRPGDPNFLSWHDAAETERQYLVERCLRHTDLQRCNRAIIPGSKDEVRLHRQRSDLYLERGNRPAALEALLVVQVINPRDLETSRALLQLVPASQQVTDERLYLARGRALLATGDVHLAIRDLRLATNRALDREAALIELKRARDIRREVVQRTCFEARDLVTCESLLIAGEPDEAELQGFIATLNAPPALPAPQVVVTTPTVETTLPKPEVRTPVKRAAPEKRKISPKEERLALAATYVNFASNQGITH